MLSGSINENTRVTRIYRNTNGSFSDANVPLLGVSDGTSAWVDYDNDGDLDLFVSGARSMNVDLAAKLYRNDSGTFVDTNTTLPGVYGSGIAWGDYDADGDADVVITGSTGYDFIGRLYRNTAGAFSDSGISLPGVQSGAVAWGDYDQDGDLDLALTGSTPSGADVSRIYRNDSTPRNLPPVAPGGLTAIPTKTGATLAWSAASDQETPAAARIGNAHHRRSWTISGLQPGQTYYWSVQAIDAGFAGSPFALEGTVTHGSAADVFSYLPLAQR